MARFGAVNHSLITRIRPWNIPVPLQNQERVAFQGEGAHNAQSRENWQSLCLRFPPFAGLFCAELFLRFAGGDMLDRRNFLSATTGLAATLAFRGNLLAQLQDLPSALPDHALLDSNEDAYWAELRKQFLIPADEVYLNNGTVGSSPAPVLRAIFDGYATTEKLDQHEPEDYPIWGYAAWNEFRDPLAAFVGCTRDEIALLRNATEANSYIANGLDLKPGDEVLMTDQEHPGGEHPWNLKAKRYGIVVKKIILPRPVKSATEVLNLFNDAITPRTRVIFFSHISTFSGVVLPAKEICALARSKGILSAVDGAHVPGMMRLNVHDIGCDMYSSSPHKWLQATKGSGFLYVRDEVIDRLWNTIVTEGWDDRKIRAERFQRIGSSNVPALWGLRAAIKLANDIGLERIERRHRFLGDYILAEMNKRGAISWTSPDPALRCAIITVNVPPVPRMDLENWLWHEHKIRIRGADPNKLRLSTPYYIQKKDIDRFLEKFDQYKREKKLA
jgi:isopenicillin-N epimerase